MQRTNIIGTSRKHIHLAAERGGKAVDMGWPDFQLWPLCPMLQWTIPWHWLPQLTVPFALSKVVDYKLQSPFSIIKKKLNLNFL